MVGIEPPHSRAWRIWEIISTWISAGLLGALVFFAIRAIGKGSNLWVVLGVALLLYSVAKVILELPLIIYQQVWANALPPDNRTLKVGWPGVLTLRYSRMTGMTLIVWIICVVLVRALNAPKSFLLNMSWVATAVVVTVVIYESISDRHQDDTREIRDSSSS